MGRGFRVANPGPLPTEFLLRAGRSVGATETDYKLDTLETIRILNLNYKPPVTERRDYIAALDKAVASMADQHEAIILFLQNELEVGGLKPFFSAKRQLFST